MTNRVRQLTSLRRPRLRHAAPATYRPELRAPILIRSSCDRDRAALERLAALDSRRVPAGSFLLAGVGGELVAAAPLDGDCEPLSDPFRATATVRALLRLQVGHVRLHQDVFASRAKTMRRADREAA